jgi:16S rRNA processing protein RimM
VSEGISEPETQWVTVAVLGKTRGNRGEITAEAFSSKLERYQSLRDVYVFPQSHPGQERLAVENVWVHGGVLIFKFVGIDNITEAEKLRGAEVRVPWSERTLLEPGEYFQSDLLGCEVVDRRSGVSLGRVTGWDDAGGAGLLVLEGGALIPFARSICVDIDPARKRIAVDLPEGLKELNTR